MGERPAILRTQFQPRSRKRDSGTLAGASWARCGLPSRTAAAPILPLPNGPAYATFCRICRAAGQPRAPTPSETAVFVFALREPLLDRMALEFGSGEDQAEIRKQVSRLIDDLGLYTIESFQRTREELILRQQQDMLELSTPVVQLYDQILAVPLIGHAGQRPYAGRDGEPAATHRGGPVRKSRSSTLPAFPPSIPWWRSIS